VTPPDTAAGPTGAVKAGRSVFAEAQMEGY